jgi:hypothetical protein
MSNITWTDKVDGTGDETGKLTAEDANAIKTAVNSKQDSDSALQLGSTGSTAMAGDTAFVSPTGAKYSQITNTSQGTGDINLDGTAASDYNYSNGASAATYTPVFTNLPAANKVLRVTLTVGGGAGVITMTWTNVTWIGTAGAAATTTNKKSTYAIIVDHNGARAAIVAEAY